MPLEDEPEVRIVDLKASGGIMHFSGKNRLVSNKHASGEGKKRRRRVWIKMSWRSNLNNYIRCSEIRRGQYPESPGHRGLL
jgi:hypothetical protein